MRKQGGKVTKTALDTGTRWKVTDLTANTESKTDDILDAMSMVDFLHKRMKHHIQLKNTETGQEFNWINP